MTTRAISSAAADIPLHRATLCGATAAWSGHNGALRYTIGQRKGLGVAMAHPVYVTGVDAANNTVHLGEAEDLAATALTANDWIWSAPADHMEAELDAGGIRVGAKYRYRQKDQAATLTRGAGGQMLLTLTSRNDPSPPARPL